MAFKRPFVAVLFVLLTLVAAVGPLGGVAAAEQAAPGTATISVSAVGTAEAAPDVAIVSVAITARADGAAAVRDQIANNASQLRSALLDANVSEGQLRTTGFSITREVRVEDGTERPVGFQGVQSFEITLSNTSRAGEIIDLAVANGANRVDGVVFTLSEERGRELRAEALREAMTNARSDAEAIAAAGNLSITGIGSVSTFSPGVLAESADVTEARAPGEPTRIDAGPVTVTAEVTVVYNATSA